VIYVLCHPKSANISYQGRKIDEDAFRDLEFGVVGLFEQHFADCFVVLSILDDLVPELPFQSLPLLVVENKLAVSFDSVVVEFTAQYPKLANEFTFSLRSPLQKRTTETHHLPYLEFPLPMKQSAIEAAFVLVGNLVDYALVYSSRTVFEAVGKRTSLLKKVPW
jgi:hypothetical protein